jgi:hypothetical protein
MSATQEVTITEFGNDSPKRMAINGIVRSDRIGARGEASVEIDTATLRRNGLLACEGYWLYHDHLDLGTHATVIQQIRHDLSTGTTEVAGQTFEALLDAKRTAKTYEVQEGDAAGIAKKVIQDAGRSGSLFIEGYRTAPSGLVDIDLRSEQVIDAIEQLAQLADAEWRVTASRYFEFAPRLGKDLSTVVLMEGRDVGAGSEVIRDLRPKINDLAAMSAVSEYTRRTAVVVLDDSSIEEIGQRQGTITYPYIVKESGLRNAAKKELARLGRLGRSATIEVLNTNRAWSAFAVGDTVRLLLPSCGVDDYFRVMVISWDSDADRVVVTGEFGAVAA